MQTVSFSQFFFSFFCGYMGGYRERTLANCSRMHECKSSWYSLCFSANCAQERAACWPAPRRDRRAVNWSRASKASIAIDVFEYVYMYAGGCEYIIYTTWLGCPFLSITIAAAPFHTHTKDQQTVLAPLQMRHDRLGISILELEPGKQKSKQMRKGHRSSAHSHS